MSTHESPWGYAGPFLHQTPYLKTDFVGRLFDAAAELLEDDKVAPVEGVSHYRPIADYLAGAIGHAALLAKQEQGLFRHEVYRDVVNALSAALGLHAWASETTTKVTAQALTAEMGDCLMPHFTAMAMSRDGESGIFAPALAAIALFVGTLDIMEIQRKTKILPRKDPKLLDAVNGLVAAILCAMAHVTYDGHKLLKKAHECRAVCEHAKTCCKRDKVALIFAHGLGEVGGQATPLPGVRGLVVDASLTGDGRLADAGIALVNVDDFIAYLDPFLAQPMDDSSALPDFPFGLDELVGIGDLAIELAPAAKGNHHPFSYSLN